MTPPDAKTAAKCRRWVKASGLRPGRYRLEVHAGRALHAELSAVEPRPEALETRPGVPGSPVLRPPAAAGEVELRAGETTEVELEVP